MFDSVFVKRVISGDARVKMPDIDFKMMVYLFLLSLLSYPTPTTMSTLDT